MCFWGWGDVYGVMVMLLNMNSALLMMLHNTHTQKQYTNTQTNKNTLAKTQKHR